MSDGRVSAVDAFFVAYQQSAGITMHLGAEVHLAGPVDRGLLLAALAATLRRWPALGQRLAPGALGLHRGEAFAVERALTIDAAPGALNRWENRPLDPMCEPPWQLLWCPGEGALSIKAHHALLDGEGFVLVALRLLDALAAAAAGREAPGDEAAAPRSRRSPAPAGAPGPPGVEGPGASLVLAGVAPGPTGHEGAGLEGEALARLRARAEASSVGLPWWVMGSWLRALFWWNSERKRGDQPTMSLEVPVSLRSSLPDPLAAGNHLAPLVLKARADQPLDRLAAALKASLRGQLQRGEHRKGQLLAAPGRYLPWGLFRRTAVTPATTGQATGHAVYLRLPHDLGARVAALSGGRLGVTGWSAYTPVCLKMGAALTALEEPGRLGLFVSHRHRAITGPQARELLDRCVADLVEAGR